MQSGELDQRIEIFRKSLQPDDIGGSVTKNILIGEEWAKVKPIQRSENKEHDRLRDTASYGFIIRYRPDIEEEDFIIWNKREYNIRFIADKGERQLYITLEAERGVTV